MPDESLKLEVVKDFSCGKEKLFTAWTEPEELKQWWQPMGKQLVEVTNELNEGGKVRYEFEEQSLIVEGVYEKVDHHNLLEYTWNWKVSAEPVRDADYKLSVKFDGDDNQSKLSVTQTGFTNEESIDPHQVGWQLALDQLEGFVSGSGGHAADDQTAPGKPEMSGYNETPEQQKVAGG